MSYEELENWQNHDEQIMDLSNKLNHLIKNCCHNLGAEDYDIIEQRMSDLTQQGLFWLAQGNPKRLIYDLKEFAMWLCDLIADKEREFWNEDF